MGTNWFDDIPYPDDLPLRRRIPQEPDIALKAVIDSFQENYRRCQDLPEMVWMAAACGIQYQHAFTRACMKRFQVPYITEDNPDGFDDDVFEQLKGNPLLDGQTIISSPNYDLVFGDIPGWETPRKHQYAETMHQTQILHAWTMFETLAADLWIAAVNEIPDPLAHCLGDCTRIKTKMSDPGDPQTPKKVSTEKFSIEELAKLCGGTFNLSVSMGNILRDTECVRFIKLRGIREAYSSAFLDRHPDTKTVYTETKDIDDALASGAVATFEGIMQESCGKSSVRVV